ncbi:MAG TPA: 23S rRNA (pseudouridine(1915)-N(3))-methyltransferase RlmH [Clostridiaceae bacterium]|nr:23S rRNA (pseudouridine(1915)-N(3))-methyltransferase RlmH [Clostridiaceae bacterium]
MNINIIAVGKLKEKYFKEGASEYLKRLSRFCKIEIIEVHDEKIPDNPNSTEIEMVKQKEGEQIKKHLKIDAYKIALCIEGEMMSSEKLSSKINSLMINGISNIVFVIGGSVGLSSEVVRDCDFQLSFSKMTFPHQLMRLILLEQIYRSFKIINNETYHK